MLKIVIGGCRTFNNYTVLKTNVDKLLNNQAITSEIIILSGHCRGVDLLAERYAYEKGFSVKIYEAQWNKYGKSAGPIRNEIMILNCDSVIAFWDGKSKGTKSLISLAEKHNKPVDVVYI